jgi:hypothetical protein
MCLVSRRAPCRNNKIDSSRGLSIDAHKNMVTSWFQVFGFYHRILQGLVLQNDVRLFSNNRNDEA